MEVNETKRSKGWLSELTMLELMAGWQNRHGKYETQIFQGPRLFEGSKEEKKVKKKERERGEG